MSAHRAYTVPFAFTSTPQDVQAGEFEEEESEPEVKLFTALPALRPSSRKKERYAFAACSSKLARFQ